MFDLEIRCDSEIDPLHCANGPARGDLRLCYRTEDNSTLKALAGLGALARTAEERGWVKAGGRWVCPACQEFRVAGERLRRVLAQQVQPIF